VLALGQYQKTAATNGTVFFTSELIAEDTKKNVEQLG
jgi:hypothetical protein